MALSYNSQSIAGGIAGVGWNLVGLLLLIW
ncbi:hypothetical protein [Porphyromonas gingivalis]|nr:hypothetical protein [Porphyromonas gingivalis]